MLPRSQPGVHFTIHDFVKIFFPKQGCLIVIAHHGNMKPISEYEELFIKLAKEGHLVLHSLLPYKSSITSPTMNQHTGVCTLHILITQLFERDNTDKNIKTISNVIKPRWSNDYFLFLFHTQDDISKSICDHCWTKLTSRMRYKLFVVLSRHRGRQKLFRCVRDYTSQRNNFIQLPNIKHLSKKGVVSKENLKEILYPDDFSPIIGKLRSVDLFLPRGNRVETEFEAGPNHHVPVLHLLQFNLTFRSVMKKNMGMGKLLQSFYNTELSNINGKYQLIPNVGRVFGCKDLHCLTAEMPKKGIKAKQNYNTSKDHYQYTLPYSQDSLAFVLRTSVKLQSWHTVALAFNPEVWITVVICIIVISLLRVILGCFKVFFRENNGNASRKCMVVVNHNSLQIIPGYIKMYLRGYVSKYLEYEADQNFFLSCAWLFMFLTILTLYSCKTIALLVKKPLQEKPNTFCEFFRNKDLNVLTNGLTAQWIANFLYPELDKRFRIFIENDDLKCVQGTLSDGTFACVNDRERLFNNILKLKKREKSLPICVNDGDECKFLYSFIAPKHAPSINALNSEIQRILETGLQEQFSLPQATDIHPCRLCKYSVT